jgi:hypothetical protein
MRRTETFEFSVKREAITLPAVPPEDIQSLLRIHVASMTLLTSYHNEVVRRGWKLLCMGI